MTQPTDVVHNYKRDLGEMRPLEPSTKAILSRYLRQPMPEALLFYDSFAKRVVYLKWLESRSQIADRIAVVRDCMLQLCIAIGAIFIARLGFYDLSSKHDFGGRHLGLKLGVGLVITLPSVISVYRLALKCLHAIEVFRRPSQTQVAEELNKKISENLPEGYSDQVKKIESQLGECVGQQQRVAQELKDKKHGRPEQMPVQEKIVVSLQEALKNLYQLRAAIERVEA